MIVCSDEERVVIALRDKGGGIPLKSLPQIWPAPALRTDCEHGRMAQELSRHRTIRCDDS